MDVIVRGSESVENFKQHNLIQESSFSIVVFLYLCLIEIVALISNITQNLGEHTRTWQQYTAHTKLQPHCELWRRICVC